jgi:hypothetical protein
MNKKFFTVFLSASSGVALANAYMSSQNFGEMISWLSSTCFALTALLILHAPSK